MLTLRVRGRDGQGNGDREAGVLQVPEGWDNQGVFPGMRQPWVEMTFLEMSRGRLSFLHRTDEGLNHQSGTLWASGQVIQPLCASVPSSAGWEQ